MSENIKIIIVLLLYIMSVWGMGVAHGYWWLEKVLPND